MSAEDTGSTAEQPAPGHALQALGAIAEQVARAHSLLIGLDFDGTLAPIAEHPDLPVLPPPLRPLLQALAAHQRIQVAIVSGRALPDLQARVGIDGLVYAGNHGLEMVGPGVQFVHPDAVATRDVLGRLAARLRQRLAAVSGALVEDKGLTLSIHYRQVDPAAIDAVGAAVRAAVAGCADRVRLTRGSMVHEIRPRVAWHKGSALRWLRDRLDGDVLPMVLGDDQTDEDAFRAFPEGVTVRVNAVVGTAARYLLADTHEVATFLERFEALLARRRIDQGPGAAPRP